MTAVEETRGVPVGDLRALFDEVKVLCGGIDQHLPADLVEVQDGLSEGELRQLLTEILVHIRGGGDADGVRRAAIAAEVRTLVEAAVAARRRVQTFASARASDTDEIGPAATGGNTGEARTPLQLFPALGLEVRPVRPTPSFLGNNVQLTEGFANTLEIRFWEDNLRLKLDLDNFRRRESRDPDADELRLMLWPRGELPKDDLYKIVPLADDIASRGVQTPPVIDCWGTAWDGNRRLAACRYILSSNDYTAEQKARARRIRVWQTDEHATKDQIDAIVTSLNFGEDFKLPWPEYVRARQVYEAYIDRLDGEASRHVLSDRDETKIRQDIGKEFGIKTGAVTRYCKMMVWALDFEDYHREQDRDEVEITNRTNDLFQYFYELDSGRGEDKLAVKLRADEGFRAIVFDMMFDGKFKNWAQVRELRRVYENSEALDLLKQAHRETSRGTGQDYVSRAIDKARQRSVALRQAGAADELARVTKWLNEDATIAVLRKLDLGVLRDFRDASRAVDGMISSLVDSTFAPPQPSEVE
ncbi:hypothetical protein ACWDXH_30635 [Micromonospora chokoriensis]